MSRIGRMPITVPAGVEAVSYTHLEAKAYLRYVRISPRKIQIVCDLIRGKDVQTAMAILMQTPKACLLYTSSPFKSSMP